MARKLIVEIIGDASSLEKSYRTAEKQTKAFGQKQQSLGRTLAKRGALVGAAAGVGVLAAAFKSGFAELEDSQKVAAQTAAVLKSTGGAANVTAKQVDDLATSILNYSGIDDEAVKSGENLLLTFTNIRNEAGKNNDIFTQATQIMADMSVALGQDMSSSAIQLGKALNDPIRGVSALRRVGVSFTDAQQKQIKALVQSGKTMEAQKLILAELNKEFGGSAKAAGDTLPGQLSKARESFKNMTAQLEVALIPAMNALAGIVTKLSVFFQRHQTIAKILIGTIATLTVTVLATNAAFKVYTATTRIAAATNFLFRRSAVSAAGGANAARLSLVGKAGLVGAAGLAAAALTTLILKATGLDKKLSSLGGKFADLVGAADTGSLVGEGTGRRAQATSAFLIARARRLERGGMSAADAALRLRQTHPALSSREAQVYATAAAGQVQHIHVNVDSREVARVVNTQNARTGHRTATQTSGLNG